MKDTLEKISRLYDLVGEMRTIIGQLKEVNVDVKIGSNPSATDPFGTAAAIRVTLNPGCEGM